MNERERCLINLYSLAKKKGLRIRDLETSCGVSVGYLARLRQDQKKSLPGSDFLLRAAATLGTSIDALMYFDFQLASDTDQYLHSFISQVILDTLTGKLAWDLDPACIPSPEIREEAVIPGHPLLCLDQALFLAGKSKEFYSSAFRPAAQNLVPRSAWRTELSKDTVLLLTKVAPEPEEPGSTDSGESVELYLYNNAAKSLSALCHTDADHPSILDRDLAELCETVSESLHCTALDHYAISAIDAYMAGRLPNQV